MNSSALISHRRDWIGSSSSFNRRGVSRKVRAKLRQNHYDHSNPSRSGSGRTWVPAIERRRRSNHLPRSQRVCYTHPITFDGSSHDEGRKETNSHYNMTVEYSRYLYVAR